MVNVGGRQGLFDKGLYEQFLSQAKTGLDPKMRDLLTNQAGGQIRGGEQSINENTVGMPIGAKLAALTSLRSNVNKGLQGSLVEGDLNARQQGAGNIFNTLGLGMQGSNMANQYAMNKYQIDKQNEFSWGDALGSLLGAGGQLGSAAIGKPK